MPEVIALGLVLGAIIAALVVLVVWDFLRQRLRITSGQYLARLGDMDARIAELELENVRLRDDLRAALELAQKDPRRIECPKG